MKESSSVFLLNMNTKWLQDSSVLLEAKVMVSKAHQKQRMLLD